MPGLSTMVLSFSRPTRTDVISLALLASAFGGALTGCREPGRKRYAPSEMANVLGVQMKQLQPAIESRVAGETRPQWVAPDRWRRVRQLYQAFGYAPLWLQERGVKDRATALLEAIRSAPDNALDTAAYPVSAIERVVDAKRLTDTASATTLADADVLLTAAYVAYATDMLVGQVDPKTVSQAWHIPADSVEVDSALVRGIASVDIRPVLDSLPPQDADYAMLKSAFARYRRIAASGGWPKISRATGASQVAALRLRLAIELLPDSGAALRDSAAVAIRDTASGTGVSKAAGQPLLKEFQARHGLRQTGIVDTETLSALNVSADERATQLAANLERHRWLPRTLGTRYVYVNVPAFQLDAYDSGQKTLSMKVVVGQEYRGKVTPVFSDSMETVVFRPYWNITPDIQAKEIGPKAASNPGYLARNNMEYYKEGGVTRIRQKPGPKNSLGLVKFLFPNEFNIYLHDTPAKQLFAQTDRAASHGCIRLEKPAEMAQWVLGWDPSRVSQAMNDGADNHGVRLPKKIPVYIVYFTAYGRDGELYFGDDVYSRDTSLEQQVTPDTVNNSPRASPRG